VEAVSEPRYEMRVGLFTVIALLMLIWGWSWLKTFSIHPPQRFVVKFHDVAGLNLNAPVNVNGVRVGTVEKIQLHGKGQVLVNLKINSEDITIPQGSLVTIQTLGLVGAKYVEITLPTVNPDEPPPPAIEPGTVLIGQDPVRVELYVNRIATNISNVTDALSTAKAQASLSEAAENAGPAIQNFKEATAKLRENMTKFSETTTSLTNAANKFGNGASSAQTFFNQGTDTLKHVSGLTQDLHVTSKKVDKVLDSPVFSADLKDTFQLAKQTADKIQTAIHELNTTVNDKSVRQDLITMLNKLADSTDHIKYSMRIVKDAKDDPQLRSDVKEIVANAKEAMEKVDAVLGNKSFVADAQLTMAKIRNAADEVDLASQNINRIVGSKHPILHLFVGGGGKKKIQVNETENGAKKQSIEIKDGAPAGKTLEINKDQQAGQDNPTATATGTRIIDSAEVTK
jgi:phospholipid/cholesterol/gamma-HCH transport system substrate-binding protein